MPMQASVCILSEHKHPPLLQYCQDSGNTNLHAKSSNAAARNVAAILPQYIARRLVI